MWEVFEMLLKRDGVSIADVSRATGISQPVFSNWKKRRGKISAENAEKIANYFGVTIGYLMGVQENEHHNSYYKDVQSELIAQQMFDDEEIHGLFHIKKNIPADRFKAFYDMITAYYKMEHPDDTYIFDQREFTDRLEDE